MFTPEQLKADSMTRKVPHFGSLVKQIDHLMDEAAKTRARRKKYRKLVKGFGK